MNIPLSSSFITQHKKNTYQILFNIQSKMSRFQPITTQDIQPFYLSSTSLSLLNIKMKSYITNFAKKMLLFFSFSVPSLYFRLNYLSAYPNTFLPKLKALSLFTCSTVYLFIHENAKITKHINKAITRIALDNYLHKQYNINKNNIHYKQYYHLLKHKINLI